MSFFSRSNQIHVYNTASETFYVVPVPNKNYALADIGIDLVLAAASLLTAYVDFKAALTNYTQAAKTAAAGKIGESVDREWQSMEILGALAQAVLNDARINSIDSLVRAYSGCKQVGSMVHKIYKPLSIAAGGATTALEQPLASIDSASQAVLAAISKRAFAIRPSEQARRVDRSQIWENPGNFTTAKGIGAALGLSDTTLFFLGVTSGKAVTFNSNSDDSWIIQEQDIVRAKYGTLEVPDPRAGFYRLPKYGLSILPAGTELRAGECISSPDHLYNFVFQETGNLVLSKRTGAAKEDLKWESGTSHKASGGCLRMQPDGNLVIYDAADKPVVALGEYGSEPRHKNRQLHVQDDGNVVLYTSDKGAVWSLKQDPGKLRI